MLNKNSIIKDIALFAGFSGREIEFIRKHSSLAEYKKGQIIYEEGSNPSCFYCIISGRVLIYAKDQSGKDQILEYLHHGKYFGIISLLTGEPHSVTARAMNDCLLLTIKKEDFDEVLLRIPQLAIDLSRTLSRRLKRKDHQKNIFESTIISVFSHYPKAGKTIYTVNLALSLKKETHKSVIIIEACPKEKVPSCAKLLEKTSEWRVFDCTGPLLDVNRAKDFISKDRSGIDLLYFSYNRQDFWSGNLMNILTLLINDYHYVILELPSLIEQSVLNILHQADLVHLLCRPQLQDLKKTHRLVMRMEEDFHIRKDNIKVIINEYNPSDLSVQEELKILDHRIFATLPKIEPHYSTQIVLDNPESEYAKVIRRISREEGDCLVGLALGIGVAYGFCHIGVLKVIEEEKIPVDIITGSSMGAIIACLWATGKSSQEILEITKEFKEQKYIWGMFDWTFPLLGFIKGNKIYGFLKKHFGNKTFYDLKIPLKIIASDVKRKEPRILESGLLADALMASCTMPGVFRPFFLKGEMLFDGGVSNPLPTEPLLEMGARKIIAVNVTPSREDILKEYQKIKEGFAGRANLLNGVKWYDIKNYFRNRLKINILDIIFSSVELLQSEVAKKESLVADIVLHPDISGMHWLELHRAAEFAKRGEEEARKNLDKIWQVINE